MDSLDTITGSWVDAWMGFTLARIGVGTGDTPDWALSYSDARFAIGVERTVRSDDLPVAVTPAAMPYQTGVTYIELTGLTPGERIRMDINGDPGVRWGIFFRTQGQSDWREASVIEFTAESSSAMVGTVNLGAVGFDADDELQTADVSVSLKRVGREDKAASSIELTGCGCAGHPGTRSAPWMCFLFVCIAMRSGRCAGKSELELSDG